MRPYYIIFCFIVDGGLLTDAKSTAQTGRQAHAEVDPSLVSVSHRPISGLKVTIRPKVRLLRLWSLPVYGSKDISYKSILACICRVVEKILRNLRLSLGNDSMCI